MCDGTICMYTFTRKRATDLVSMPNSLTEEKAWKKTVWTLVAYTNGTIFARLFFRQVAFINLNRPHAILPVSVL